MQILNNKKVRATLLKSVLLLLFCGTLFSSCKKEKKIERSFEVNQIGLLPPNAGKTKLKTKEQFVAILYTNLFQKALSANQIFDISQCMESIGDQELAREVVISNFMNKPGTIIPNKAEMAADINYFVENTYIRFLVRKPTEAEKTFFYNYLTARITPTDTILPELVYFSFALSDEYMYY